jgi:hypothetical protein
MIMSKSRTVKNKVVFKTHSRSTHVTMALKAGKPLPAVDVNGKVMNAKAETYKCPNSDIYTNLRDSNLANWEREVMQMRTLSHSRASKPPYVSTELQLGIPRGAARGEMQIINGEGVSPFEKSLKRININGVGLSTIHNMGNLTVEGQA